MKNAHLLPAKLPVSSYINSDNGKLSITSEIVSGSYSVNKSLYITNDEKVKKGDWYIVNDTEIYRCKKVVLNLIYSYEHSFEENETEYATDSSNCKKIILTTNLEFIKKGVLSIDLCFLKWFIHNSSCEEIGAKHIINEYVAKRNTRVFNINIPKKRPEYEWSEPLLSTIPTIKPETKQETLEEVVERLYPDGCDGTNTSAEIYRRLWIEGAKHQQEQDKNKFSEEEVLELLQKRTDYVLNANTFLSDVKKWFEKFKKK